MERKRPKPIIYVWPDLVMGITWGVILGHLAGWW